MTDPMPCKKCGALHARCSAHRRDGEPCTQWPVTGLSVCKQHGGLNPAAREAGRARMLEATIAGELEKRGWEPITDPLAAYADLAGEVWSFKELCRAQINVLSSWVGFNKDDEEYARALVTVYERALDRAGKQLHDMLRLGLDHQALRQAKERPSRELAESFNRILEFVLNGLTLSEEQRRQVPELLAQAIRKEQL